MNTDPIQMLRTKKDVHTAAKERYKGTVWTVITRYRANPNISDQNGWTSLQIIVVNEQLEMIR